MRKCVVILAGLLFCETIAFGQQQPKDSSGNSSVEDINRQKQNPVSGLRSVFLQDVILPAGDGNANSFSVQPVWPFRLGKKWAFNTYTIIPIQWVPNIAGSGKASGLGNILFNGFFRPAEPPRGIFHWGIGPALELPTRSDPALGSNRFSLGPTALIYLNGKKLSGGLVAQHLWSLGGTGINKVSLFSAQYILYYNFPKAWYVESNATITANWPAARSDVWTVPLGGGPGKTFQIGKGGLFYSAALQAFYNAARPEYVGSWMLVAQFQVIFP